jgi:methyl-accepting chemotaxis protein
VVKVGIIKNIKLNEIEDGLKEIVGLSFQTKLFQEEYTDVINQIKDSKSRISSGDISKDVYGKNKILLENERKKLVKKINETINKMQRANGNIQRIIGENKI